MAEKAPAKASTTQKADGLRAFREQRYAANHPEPKPAKSGKKSKKAKARK